ncbi:MAG: primosomal protein N' [Clostridiaceae bacterium]|nr:primosomal protein N' [Clostridiaceae bacterium]
MAKIASVVLSNSTREFDKEYHYEIPEELTYKTEPGMRVIVPFGRTNALKEAFIINIFDEDTSKDQKNNFKELKKIKKVTDEKPVLSREMINLASWMKERYICTYYDAIKCMVPAGSKVKAYKMVYLKDDNENNPDNVYVQIMKGNETLLNENEKFINENEKLIIDYIIKSNNQCQLDELKKNINIKSFSKVIKGLIEKGLIDIREEYVTGIKEKYIRVAYSLLPSETISDLIESNKIKRIQQIKVLEVLMENEYVPVQDIVKFAGVSPSVLDTLRRYGYIDFKEIEVKRDPFSHRIYEKTEALKPTTEQKEILQILKAQKDKKLFAEYLLYGVTGSGKTEVYLQLIQYTIEKGEQAIVLVPEISLTPQMIDRFKGRFGNQVAVLHSRLSLGERYDQWRLIRERKVNVVIGARSAVFAPLDNIGLIVVDEEHEASYKSEITPKYNAAEIARYICKRRNAILLLGSATPSVETYYRAVSGKMGLLIMKERANKMLLPKVKIIDMREELNKGNRTIFSRLLSSEIEKNISSGQQTILLLNRRGYSPFVLCRNCGYVVKCTNCSITMTYHSMRNRLTCHYCGYTIKVPEKCPKCNSVNIRHFGAGTQKLEEEIKKNFPTASVIRMDMDTTTYKNSHEDILRKFKEDNINIMVGTQMVAKGHDFPNVTLVGVLAADSILNLGDYRASEKTFQLLTQVSGRAGRGNIPGRVIVQAYNIDDYSIIAASNHDFSAFYNKEIIIRKQTKVPPFTNIASVILSGNNDKAVFESSKMINTMLKEVFKKYVESEYKYEILGPLKPPIEKINNKFRWRIILKSEDIDILVKVLSEVSDSFYRSKNKRASLSIDINPVNML